MARITVEDCQQRVDNRFLLVQMAIKRVHQYREGYEPPCAKLPPERFCLMTTVFTTPCPAITRPPQRSSLLGTNCPRGGFPRGAAALMYNL